MILGQLVVIDAIDDGKVGAFRRRGDHDALGACFQMRRGLVARGEMAGAFHRDVDAELLMRELRRILDRGAFDLMAFDPDLVAFDQNLMRKTPVHAVEPQADARWFRPVPDR